MPYIQSANELRSSFGKNKITIELNKKVALVAHGNKKRDLVEWAKYNRVFLALHTIHAAGTAGALLEQELGFPIHRLESGPLGGDQQIGAKIVDGDIDFLIFGSDWFQSRKNLSECEYEMPSFCFTTPRSSDNA